MNAEVIKIHLRDLPNGEVGQILDKDDFIRLISKYKLTLMGFKEMGLSRKLWDNTLKYHGWGVNDIEGLRKKPYKESKHIASYKGFSTKIPIENIRLSTRGNDSKIQDLAKYVDSYFPGTLEKYSKYHDNPEEVNKWFLDIGREIKEINQAIRYMNRRVVKWAKKKSLKYKNIINSKLEHHFAKILDELGLNYEPQYNIDKYFYDFYIPQYNFLIEVDGGGHINKTDEIKHKLAIDNDIPLIRVKVKNTLELKRDYEKIKSQISKKIR